MSKSIAFMSACALIAVAATPLGAAPKPINAADPTDGTGCLVHGGTAQAYVLDAACKYHLLTKADKDGNRVFLHYQDKGNLQPGQTAPDKAVTIEITNTIAGQSCSGTEVITPSGNYSSDLSCK